MAILLDDIISELKKLYEKEKGLRNRILVEKAIIALTDLKKQKEEKAF